MIYYINTSEIPSELSLCSLMRYRVDHSTVKFISTCGHVISSMYFFLPFDQEPAMWPANSCLKISVLLLVIFCSCVIEFTLLCENDRLVPQAIREWFYIFSWSKEQWSNDKTIIIELGYHRISLFVSVSQINNNYYHLPQPLASGNDLLTSDKSWYFAQPGTIILLSNNDLCPVTACSLRSHRNSKSFYYIFRALCVPWLVNLSVLILYYGHLDFAVCFPVHFNFLVI